MCGEPLAVDDVKDLEIVGMNLPVNSSALIFLKVALSQKVQDSFFIANMTWQEI